MYALIIVSFIFAPLAFAAVEPWAYVPLYALYFLGAAALYAKGADNYENPLRKTLLPAVLALAALGLLQLLNQHPINSPSSLLFTTWRLNTFNAVLLWLWYAAVMYCAAKTIKTPAQLSGLLWTLFGMGVFVSLMGMLQKTGPDDTIVYGLRKVMGQPFGPFVNRDHGAFFLAMAGMAGLGLFFGGFRPLFAQHSRTKLFDLLAVQFLKFVMLVAVVAGIVKTGSRGGLHSFMAAAAFMGFVSSGFLRRKAHRAAAWLALLALLAGYGLLLSKYRILLGLDGDNVVGSVAIRFSIYKSGWAMFKDFPVFGTGLGAVEHAFPYYARPDLGTAAVVRHVHSDWIELFLQTGAAGGLIYLAGLFGALYLYYRGWLRCRSFTVKAVYGGALGAALVGMLHSFVDFGLQMPANALVFYALLGALGSRPAALGRGLSPDEEEQEPEPRRPPRAPANLAAVAALLLAAAAAPQYLAWQDEQRAAAAESGEKLKLRAAALRLQPGPWQAFRLAAEYYNRGLADKTAPCALFKKADEIAAPYLRRVPVNSGLLALDRNLRLQLANCYNRPLVVLNAPRPAAAPQPPTENASRP